MHSSTNMVAGYPYPVLKIKSTALAKNLSLLKNIAGDSTKVLIPVKANAYGCGLKEILPFFKDNPVDYLGVANPQEGSNLRQLDWQGQILNLGGFYKENISVFFENNVTPSITDLEHIEWLNSAAKLYSRKIKVHLKFDLGMGRLGLKIQDYEQVVHQLNSAKNIVVEGIFTHFPNAGTSKDVKTDNIIKSFSKVTESLISDCNLNREDVILHAANSYGVLFHDTSYFDMIRPGIVFYGYFQTEEDRIKYLKDFPIEPCLELYANPISIRKLLRGDKVSYGSTHVIEEESVKVAVIPLGYADGIPRALSNQVSFDGHLLAGNVTMDQIVLKNIESKDQKVCLLGENNPSLEEWAEKVGTISYEVMTGFGHRVNRILI